LDTTPPAARLGGSTSQKLGARVSVSVFCPDEACLVTAGGSVRVPRVGAVKAKLYKLGKVSGVIARGATSALRPQLSSAARRAIRRALAHHHRITVKLEIVVADAAQNTMTLTRQVKLRR